MRRLRFDERGEATTELVLVTPVLLLLIAFVVQFALWFHANHVAEAAAQEGARAARVIGGTPAAGEARARRFLVGTGPSMVLDSAVTATRDQRTVHVEVRGRVPSVVPGIHWGVSASAISPVERLTTRDEP